MLNEVEHRVVPIGVMARLLHVPSRWLRAEVEAGRIPALRAGDRFVLRPDVVMQIVAKRAAGETVTSDSTPAEGRP